MMDEYKALENFELDCTQYFDPDADECVFFFPFSVVLRRSDRYTLKQDELHREFVRLMEGFVEKYIRSLGCTLDGFYEAVRAQMDATSQGGDDARECMEVLFEMADIRVWVSGMRARVRYRRLQVSALNQDA